MAPRGDRGRFQQELCYLVSKLQVLIPYLDAWEGSRVFGGVQGEQGTKWPPPGSRFKLNRLNF